MVEEGGGYICFLLKSLFFGSVYFWFFVFFLCGRFLIFFRGLFIFCYVGIFRGLGVFVIFSLFIRFDWYEVISIVIIGLLWML